MDVGQELLIQGLKQLNGQTSATPTAGSCAVANRRLSWSLNFNTMMFRLSLKCCFYLKPPVYGPHSLCFVLFMFMCGKWAHEFQHHYASEDQQDPGLRWRQLHRRMSWIASKREKQQCLGLIETLAFNKMTIVIKHQKDSTYPRGLINQPDLHSLQSSFQHVRLICNHPLTHQWYQWQ